MCSVTQWSLDVVAYMPHCRNTNVLNNTIQHNTLNYCTTSCFCDQVIYFTVCSPY